MGLQKGRKLTKVQVSMPSPGPLSAEDYIDSMWLRDDYTGKVIEAQFFYPNGKPQANGRSGAPADDTVAVDPVFIARVPIDGQGFGDRVVPVVHSAAGRVWQGAKLALK